MRRQIAIILLSVVGTVAVTSPVATADPQSLSTDPFALDGAQNILDEKHFGIINGKVTAGIPYRDALGVRGLWAPPLVSHDFRLDITVLGKSVPTKRYTWRPFCVERSGEVQGIDVRSATVLLPGTRGGIVAICLTNPGTSQRIIPLAISASGALDRLEKWEFGQPESRTATTRAIASGQFRLHQGTMGIAIQGSDLIKWHDTSPCGRASVTIPPAESVRLWTAFSIGQIADAVGTCQAIALDPDKAIRSAEAAYRRQVDHLFQRIPQLESSCSELDRFYVRSLVHLLTNRWDVPEFLLQPYYSTGSIRGGCVCEYLWNYGDCWEIFPLYDPDANRVHIKAFLAADMTRHFAFEPFHGSAFGPWYMVNQEKIIGLVYHHVTNTGDSAFLQEKVDGRTVLEHTLAAARFGDDPSKPVALIDYGASNSHLELRRGIPYNHVMPDLNGRRYQSFVLAAELADLAGETEAAAALRRRAKDLAVVLKRELWNPNTRWFDFIDGKGRKNARYTVQMFKLFGSGVLDREEEEGLLGHLLDENEFLATYGLHSMAQPDPAYDPADIDNGGPGICTGFVGQIAEKLYRAGKPDAAENVLKRVLWWGQRLPYWGDSIVANKIDYRKDTPLQCTIDGVALAQCVIFGMFGVQAQCNGDLRIDPRPPRFAPKMTLKGLRLRGHTLDIVVEGEQYEVREGERRLRASIGQPIAVRGGRLRLEDASRNY